MTAVEPLWVVRAGLVPYRRAWAWQRALVERRLAGEVPDVALLLEHPHVYTIGKRGSERDVLAGPEWLAAQGAEVVRTDRGGQVTYHGPGQLVGYPVVRLGSRPDVRGLVDSVLGALVATAAGFGVEARAETGELAGVWVGGAKLAALGMRISRGVSSHGFAFNCSTVLERFNAIVPCGQPTARACSLTELLGRPVPVAEVLPPATRHLAASLGRRPVDVDLASLDLPAEDAALSPDPERVDA